jgi:GT2 family glycosyltransferase
MALEGNGVRVIRAPERQSSYYARNQGASAGSGDWLLFLDADVDPPQDLLDRYFGGKPPDERTAVLAGEVQDEPITGASRPPIAARYAALRAPMSQSNTLRNGSGYAQTANCAVRRRAFESVRGFREELRSGGDADLCFRLRRDGWGIEVRERATVVHRSRQTLGSLLRQRARHGSGAAWLDHEYPGAFPRARWLGLGKSSALSFAGATVALAQGRNDDSLTGFIDPLCMWAFELGRLWPNTVRENR